jgi:hypothetical protein
MGGGIGGDPGDVAGDSTGQGLIEEDPEGKHLAIGVANFSNGMNSYLRLGNASSAAGTTDVPTGEDLASYVQGFSDDTRDRGSGANQAPPQYFDPTFQSLFTGDPTIGPRRIESAILHTKGGWRDHTDGNRITTTRGDKVEVIQGNYKLVVLGRQDDSTATTNPAARQSLLDNSAGLEMSGGVTDMDGDAAFASSADPGTGAPDASRDQAVLAVEYVWGPDSDGSYGWTMTTTTGHEHPSSTDRGNYRVINNNYVDYQEDNYGTSAQNVSKMISKTYANEMNTSIDVKGVNSTKLYGNTVENYTLALHLLNNNFAVIMNEVDIAVTIGLVQVAAINLNAFLGAVVNLNAVVTADEHMGIHTDLHVGSHIDTRMGVHNDVHTGNHVDLHLGTHTEMHTGTHVQLDTEIVALNLQSGLRLHMPQGTMTFVSGTVGKLTVEGKGHVDVDSATVQRVATQIMRS